MPPTIQQRLEAANQVALETSQGCGDTVYTRAYSGAVESILASLPDRDRADALALAKRTGDYATPAQIEAMDERDDDLCSHGLDEQTCPIGCFENDE